MALSLLDQDLEYAWLASRQNSRFLCNGLAHHGIDDCLRGFIGKVIDTGKVAAKYYILFHAIPLILKLKKAKGIKPVLKNIGTSFYDYLKSLCFMGFLVGLLRGAMCCTNHCAASPNLKSSLLPGCLLSGGSILFESGSRRKQIGFFVCSKALRSCYICVKRVLGLNFKNEQIGMHILAMSLLYYVYNHHGESLKFKNLFDLVFGTD